MTKTSGVWSVLSGLVACGALSGCSPADRVPYTTDPTISDPTPTTPTTTNNGLQPLFQGKTERATGKVAPISGGTLLVTSDNHAVASDPDRDQVHIADLSKRSVVSVSLKEGDEPGRVVQGPTGTAYVVARRGGALLAVDVAGATVRRIPVCAAPRGVAYDPSASKLYVTCRSGLLVELDPMTDAVVARHQLDPDLRDVVLSGDNLVVTRFKTAEILVVNRDGEVLKRQQPQGQSISGASVTPAVAYRTLALPGGGVLVGHVNSSNTTLPSGAGAYYGAACGGSVADVNVSVVNPNMGATGSTSTGMSTSSNTIGGATGPVDLALSADGGRVAILATGNSWQVPNAPTRSTNLWVASQSQLQTGAFVGTCAGFGGGTANANTVEGEPVAVAFDSSNHWVTQSREPAQLQLEDGSKISLAADRRFDTGFAMFHMNTGGGIACTSCHPEAGEDGHTWQFSIGPRRSQTLEGGASQRAPFHWSGDLVTFDDLVDEVMLKRMSLSANVDETQRGALKDWLDSVPKAPTADDLDAAAVERGRTLFTSGTLACATCHSGDQYTDNKPHDVGTGGAFITPSLIDVNVRAPLFHDGCALTLDGRFGPCGGGDLHGVTSKMTRAERDDLVAFMRSL
ncbi:MAG TPA: cytochrome-c peroxidase [Polyangiaceae bacterium]|nr:cytochrome-c peroxidase [Polyangiaceae bacterium]